MGAKLLEWRRPNGHLDTFLVGRIRPEPCKWALSLNELKWNGAECRGSSHEPVPNSHPVSVRVPAPESSPVPPSTLTSADRSPLDGRTAVLPAGLTAPAWRCAQRRYSRFFRARGLAAKAKGRSLAPVFWPFHLEVWKATPSYVPLSASDPRFSSRSSVFARFCLSCWHQEWTSGRLGAHTANITPPNAHGHTVTVAQNENLSDLSAQHEA